MCDQGKEARASLDPRFVFLISRLVPRPRLFLHLVASLPTGACFSLCFATLWRRARRACQTPCVAALC